MTGFDVGFKVTARCAGCDRKIADWEERTKGTGEPSAQVRAENGGGYLVDSRRACECGARRVRVSFRVG